MYHSWSAHAYMLSSKVHAERGCTAKFHRSPQCPGSIVVFALGGEYGAIRLHDGSTEPRAVGW